MRSSRPWDSNQPQHVDEAFDIAPCGLMQTSDDGVFRRVNAMFCGWLGYDRDALVGRVKLQDLLTMGGRIFHQTHWSPLLRMQGSISEVKLELVHRDGSLVPMVLNAIRREQAGGFVHDLAAYIARDRDRYERELLVSRKRLEALVDDTKRLEMLASDRALLAEQMIGIVSHDLRNPLATISMAADMLEEVDLAGRTRLSQQIKRATNRANRLIADLLDFTQARVGAGLPVLIAGADLHEVVAEALEGLRIAYPSRVLDHVPVGSGRCEIDANRFAQMLGNLVSNATAYGARERPITITSCVGPDTISVAVHNHGEQIQAATLANLFLPMTRGTSGPSKVHSVGLGLFIVREIAKAHGGMASVSSEPTGETTFDVTVPRWTTGGPS
jgi:sigma-B regulation protein RsbU (phosphoserine phosphatase)